MPDKNISRQGFLALAWAAAGTLALTEFSLVGLRFLTPRPIDGKFGGVFNLGKPTDVPMGSATSVEAGRFYLVRLNEGGFLAIYRRCSHLGCAVPFDPASGRFICPCHGSEFKLDGEVLNDPAPRPLDLFKISLNEDGEILVDTGSPIARDRVTPDHIFIA